jgi:hypothetical protein
LIHGTSEDHGLEEEGFRIGHPTVVDPHKERSGYSDLVLPRIEQIHLDTPDSVVRILEDPLKISFGRDRNRVSSY